MANKSLNEVYSKLVANVYEEDIRSQLSYLSMVSDHRKISLEYLISRNILFIPNNEYIRHFIGSDADTYGCELYVDGKCLWTLYVLIPVTDLSGEVVGLTGWDAYHKYQELAENAYGLSMYKVSSKHVFDRDKYFLSDAELLKKTFDKRAIAITDGVFDSVSLNYRGIPALALLGSTFSPEILYFLRWYKKIYVAADNDDAGVKLYQRLKRALPNVYRIMQGDTKDIEEYLRPDGIDGPITRQIKTAMFSEEKSDIILK